MGRRIAARHSWRSTTTSGTVAQNRQWAGGLRSACCCAAILFGLLLVVDAGNATLTGVRAAMWAGLASLLFAVLLPPRVSAGHGWLETRDLLRTRRVRTDRLTSLVWSDGVTQRLVLKDTDSGPVPLDPRVLLDNPLLWHLLDEGARLSQRRGTLAGGTDALRRLSSSVDGETARAVFTASGMDA
ncbi:hypothetical protein ACWGN5_08320 [Streptomyces sp. NPDC055815]